MREEALAAPADARAVRPTYRIWNRCGSGLQYSVFDLRNGRVLKVPRSFPAQFWRLIRVKRPRSRAAIIDILERVRRQKGLIATSFANLESIMPRMDRGLVGNPELLSGGCYTQDKATPL